MGCGGLAVRACASLPPLPLCTACVVQGAACAVVCVLLCCAAVRVEWGRWGGGEPSPGFGVFVVVYLGGCIFSLSNRPSLPPPTSRSRLLCLFAYVCFAMAVHHWPLGLAPAFPSSCCRIHRGMGGWGGGGGRAHTLALSSRGTPTHAPLLTPSPHTQCTRITRTLHHPAPTYLCNNRWEGGRDGCHDKLALL